MWFSADKLIHSLRQKAWNSYKKCVQFNNSDNHGGFYMYCIWIVCSINHITSFSLSALGKKTALTYVKWSPAHGETKQEKQQHGQRILSAHAWPGEGALKTCLHYTEGWEQQKKNFCTKEEYEHHNYPNIYSVPTN